MLQKKVKVLSPRIFDLDNIEIDLFFDEPRAALPCIKIENAFKLLETIYHAVLNDKDVIFEYQKNNSQIIVTRENHSKCYINETNSTITFDDFDKFFSKSDHSSLLQVIKNNEHISETNLKQGQAVIIDLKQYKLELLKKEGDTYIELNTFSNIFMTYSSSNLLFNGSNVFLTIKDSLFEEETTFHDTKSLNKDQEVIENNYYNLCLALDLHYGLSKERGIISFDEFFYRKGLKEGLLSFDEAQYSETLLKVFNEYLNDEHSDIEHYSYRKNTKSSTKKLNRFFLLSKHRNLRKKYYPSDIKEYDVIGRTGFITIDRLSNDTITLIKNVKEHTSFDNINSLVLDFSLCNNGSLFEGYQILSEFLSDFSFNFKSLYTGASLKTSYHFDGVDRDIELYCIVSNCNYYVSSIVANIFKNSNKCKLIGSKTSGSVCDKRSITTLFGDILTISVGYKMLDIETNGVVPDIELDVENIYDRKLIARIIAIENSIDFDDTLISK